MQWNNRIQDKPNKQTREKKKTLNCWWHQHESRSNEPTCSPLIGPSRRFRWRGFLSEQQRGRAAAESHRWPLPRLGPTPPASSSRASCSSGPNSPQQAPLTEAPLFTCRPIRRVPPRPCQVGVQMFFKCHPLNVKSGGDENGGNRLQVGVPAEANTLEGRAGWDTEGQAWQTARQTDGSQVKQNVVFSVKLEKKQKPNWYATTLVLAQVNSALASPCKILEQLDDKANTLSSVSTKKIMKPNELFFFPYCFTT